MIENEMLYKDFLLKLKKEDLLKILEDYNKLGDIFDETKVELLKLKKNELINKIIDVKDKYFKYLIMSLDLEDFGLLKKLILKKNDINFLNDNKVFINYLVDKKVLIQKDNLEILKEVKQVLKECLKSKEVANYVKLWDRIYKLADGVIIAYGVVERSFFDIIISGIINHDLIIPKLDFYYKKEYFIDKNKLMSNKLKNKKRISRYFKNNNYKKFTNKEYVLMGNCSFHHTIKSYKKFIRMLKSNYIFKNNDIDFVDKNIVIPYLYNSLNEEDIAKKNLEDTIISLFEFKGDKLKNKMLDEIIKIRDEFPLWEYRGFSKKEVNI